MKFSVVIPCHDRLELLRKAVYTVLDQSECEICIFDNASNPSLEEYLKELPADRVRYDRSEIFLSVTESWERAIKIATGDYITFLGDDDGLIPDYYSQVNSILETFSKPEIIYSSFYQFLYPGVAPWALQGYVSEVKNGFFFKDQNIPFLLPKEAALKAVEGSFSLQRNFAFNIQAFIFKRTFLQRLQKEGHLFHSSYPDYYLANVVFASADSIVIAPYPLSIAGVSKASVGFSLFNNLEDRFEQILNTRLGMDPFYEKIKSSLLPGPAYNNHYVTCMHHVAAFVDPGFDLKIDMHRYRRLQIYCLAKNLSKKNFTDFSLWKKLNFAEKLYACKIIIYLMLSRFSLLSRLVNTYLDSQFTMTQYNCVERRCSVGEYSCLTDVYNALKSKKFR